MERALNDYENIACLSIIDFYLQRPKKIEHVCFRKFTFYLTLQGKK